MERDIITIDEELCNGCGNCVPGCPEGALQIIDGKARLVNDLFCDGLGACIGECPEGAISIEKREAVPYDEETVMSNIVKHGTNTIIAHLKHLKDHNEMGYFNIAVDYLKRHNIPVPDQFVEGNESEVEEQMACGCPGSMAREIKQQDSGHEDDAAIELKSQLSQWPVQLQLLNPGVPYLKDADLLIAADCVPFSYANFHQKFLKDKKLIIFCPKLDTTIDSYIDKLAEIFKVQNIKSISIVHMEVPCCFGVGQIVKKALQNAGKNIDVKDYTVSVSGEVIG